MIEQRETDALLDSQTALNVDTPLLQPSKDHNAHKPTCSHALRVIIVASLVLLISDLAGYAAFAPQLDIYEAIICRQYYARLSNSNLVPSFLDHQDCKVAAVQSELALINGWSDTFPQIPGKRANNFKHDHISYFLVQELFWPYHTAL